LYVFEVSDLKRSPLAFFCVNMQVIHALSFPPQTLTLEPPS